MIMAKWSQHGSQSLHYGSKQDFQIGICLHMIPVHISYTTKMNIKKNVG